MIARLAFIGLATFVFSTGAANAADAPLKVLRHMTFAVTTDAVSGTATKVAGFDGATSGSVTDRTGSTVSNGTIAIDVVGATADGGLVVDASEDSTETRAPAVRVGITDQSLFFDPSRVVTPEEKTLLHYLARDFIKAGELAVGTTWTDAMSATGVTDKKTYRVTAVDEDAKTITVDIVGETTVTGPHGYEDRSRGTLVYDTGTLVPISLLLSTRTTIEAIGRLTTVDSKLSSTLRDDSFRKH